MNCYFHPEKESVITCGQCGVPMCRECEENAFVRLDGGRGQACCIRCSFTAVQSDIDLEKKFMKKRLIKLIICAFFIILGLILKSIYNSLGSLFVCWFIAGVISNIGVKNNGGSVKSQVNNAIFEYEHPYLNLAANIIGCTLTGPVYLVFGLIGYLVTYFQYKKDLVTLAAIQEAAK